MTVVVDLDDFDDDEIVEYVVRRRLVQRVIDADSGQQNKGRTPPQ